MPRPGWLRVWQLRGVQARATARRTLEQTITEAAAQHAGVPAPQITVGRETQGQPILTGLPAGYACALTYTHGLALAALTCGMGVGIDCEQTEVRADWRAMAAEFFNAEENAALRTAADEAAERQMFYRFWTRREARAKADGRGMFTTPTPCPTEGSLGPLLAWTEVGPGAWLLDLDLGKNLVGCVTVTLAGPS